MTYQKPTLQALQHVVIELTDAYYLETAKNRTNTQRLSYLALLKQVTENTRSMGVPTSITRLLIGALIFQMEVIANEYYLRSPEGSDMYMLLKNQLHLTKENVLDDQERLIYLYEFYEHMQKHYTNDHFSALKNEHHGLQWHHKENLLSDIHAIAALIRARDAKRIGLLVHATPEWDALKKGTPKLAEAYRLSIKNQWSFYKDPSREKMLRFIEWIDQSFSFFYPSVEIITDDIKTRVEDSLKLETDARRGLILFVTMKIDQSYKWLDPKGGYLTNGSALFKESVSLLNVRDVSEVSCDHRVKWLSALSDHITRMKEHPTYYQAKLTEWQKKGFREIESELTAFQKEIIHYRGKQEIKKLEPARSTTVMGTGISYAASGVIRYGMKAGVASTMGGVLATGAGGPVGFAVYTGGALVATGLGKLIGEGVVGATVAAICSWMLNRICDSVGSSAAQVVQFQYSASEEGILSLRSRLKPADEVIFREWVNTLLKMPTDIVSEMEKQSIRNVMGLSKDEFLSPLLFALPEKEPEVVSEVVMPRMRENYF